MKILRVISVLAFTLGMAPDLFGQYDSGYGGNQTAPNSSVGKIVEVDCNYPVKTSTAKKQYCQETLVAQSSERLVPSEASIISCIQSNKMTSLKHTFFVTAAGGKTMTKTLVQFKNGNETCETDFKRVFAHWKVTDKGQIVRVPSHFEAISTTCKL